MTDGGELLHGVSYDPNELAMRVYDCMIKSVIETETSEDERDRIVDEISDLHALDDHTERIDPGLTIKAVMTEIIGARRTMAIFNTIACRLGRTAYVRG